MATFDFRILLETVEGKKTSYMSQSFVDTSVDLVLSASQVYNRITGSVSCSYQNSPLFSGSDFNTSLTFKDSNLLSASLLDSQNTGSIRFTSLNTEYDRLLRYKFIGEKVCNVLGLPNSQWIYTDQVRFPVDDESNVFQGNIDVNTAFISDTLTFANNANINSDVQFLIDTGSDRYIKFIDERGSGALGLIMGYDKSEDIYEINSPGDKTFNILNFNKVSGSSTSTGSFGMIEFADGTSQTTAGGGGSGTPGGSNTQVQFNDGGSLGGDATFFFNKSTNTLTVDDVTLTGTLNVAQDITHTLDTDTKIRFEDDKITLTTGGTNTVIQEGHITASGNISSSNTSTGSFGKIQGSGSATESFLQQDINTTLNADVGAISTGTTISAGTSIESILRQILIDFIPPTFTAFTISNLDTDIEVGDTEQSTINAGTFTTASSTSDNSGFENNGGSFQLSLSGNATDDGNISATYAGNGTISFTSPSSISVKRTSVGTVTFTLTGTDSNSNETARTDTITFRHPIFYGGSSNTGASLNDSVLSSIIGDISSSVTTTTGTSQIKVTTTTPNESGRGKQTLLNTTSTSNLPTDTKIKLPASVANSSNFTYIIYPSSYGDLTSILKNDVQDEFGTFTKLGTANHERYTGVNTTYVVYKSSGQNAFQENDTLTLND